MKDEDCEDRAQAQLASLKRSMRKTLEDATVRAMHKMMAEFEAKSDQRLMEDWGPGPHEHHSLPKLAEQPAQQQEPVAKDWRHVIPGRRHTDQWDSARVADYNQGWNDCQKKTKTELEKLYTSPQPSKPLTDEEIEEVWRRVQANDFHDCVQPFARAIEAAHGIKEKNNG